MVQGKETRSLLQNTSGRGWSARNMDVGALADEIADVLGFQVGLKWKIIPTGIKEQLNDDKKAEH